MKRFLTVAVAMLALTGMGQVAMRKLEDLTNTNLVCVTDYGPQVLSLTQRVTGLEGSSNDWSKTVSNLAALSNNVASLSSRVAATNALFSAWFSGLQSRTSYWDTAYSWGDWSVAVGANTAAIAVLETNTVTRAGTNRWETGSHAGLASTQALEAAIAPLRYPARWYVSDDSNRWAEWDGSNVVVRYEVAHTSNLVCQCSFATALGVELNGALPFPFSVGGWTSGFMDDGVPFVVYPSEDGATWMDYDEAVSYPCSINASGTGTGVGILDLVPAVTTNETDRFYLPDSAIPPELTDLGLLTAWLNSMYYTKSQTDAAKELHADSYTNLVWRSVFSNGWHWLVAYTNTP